MDDEYKEYEEFEKKIITTYPEMFVNPYGGIGVGKGWWRIIETLCSNIQAHIDSVNSRRAWFQKNNPDNEIIPKAVEQVRVAQIKEKFGGLRFYYDGGDDVIRGMVMLAEAWADRSCEICGDPGTRRDGGWIKTLCHEHDADRRREQRRLEKND